VCLPVMIGVRVDGTKELIALADGFRESSESWADLLRSCHRRAMGHRYLRSVTPRWGSGRPYLRFSPHRLAAVLVQRRRQRPCRPAEVGASRCQSRAGRDLQRRGQRSRPDRGRVVTAPGQPSCSGGEM
jgi:plasmid stabilization system protein ParE